MKLKAAIVALSMSVPLVGFAQVTDTVLVEVAEPAQVVQGEGYTFEPVQTESFTNQSKRFNDWAISAGGGTSLIQTGNITSINNGAGKWLFGWAAYFSVDKAINHTFGLKLQYDKGETRQGYANTKDHLTNTKAARTQYDAISLLGDLNLSNLLRRVDNRSPFRWALHAYAGAGTLAYRAYLVQPAPVYKQALVTEVKPFKATSLFAQWGAGLKFRATKSLDIEARAMYVYTGDDKFDGAVGSSLNNTNKVSDNMVNATLGLTYNIGKHDSHLFWHDPMQELYSRTDQLATRELDFQVCKSGDNDDDGVCDDWDRELDTPRGARVDGAGVALDTDLDGVIDLYDKCVTVPGPKENDGCPYEDASSGVTKGLEGVEFDFDSSRILSSNQGILNDAASYINSTDPNANYTVVGATDAAGSVQYNQGLSERRAKSVQDYLIKNGVSASRLNSVGHGKSDLKYPECVPTSKCPEWKNRANRRVYFQKR